MKTGNSAEELIEVKNLTKVYQSPRGDVLALEDVSFSVKKGEFICIVGRSGCGKSTLLNVISGLIPETSGEIRIAGKLLKGPQPNIGIVFQFPVLFPWRTVIKNIMLPLEVLKLGKKYYEKIPELVKLVGLSGFENKYPHELSGGMQQRVSICMALIHDPLLLLMDEPFGALDALTRYEMNFELLRIWHETKKTILFITHNVEEAVFLADRVLVMTPRPGKIAKEIVIDLPRPRRLEHREEKKFSEYILDIHKLLGLG
ncbi:ABC transporter ATP-binding protein [Candidatus Hecatella orcuttiae]|jgi:NitT/TauT family transport system ATP-binding protein|uniref:ABC transporter ATP-binding protein n=1 Tax=Candidatus Hecatella orcuttiae TaxID=1935119 RepID=UPI002867F51F|nr:ABC transporter ATP-binding protein [Candidatus Hecatella orcuttiae]